MGAAGKIQTRVDQNLDAAKVVACCCIVQWCMPVRLNINTSERSPISQDGADAPTSIYCSNISAVGDEHLANGGLIEHPRCKVKCRVPAMKTVTDVEDQRDQ